VVSSAHARISNLAEEWWHVHMAATKPWTLEELDRLPEDGNTYELVLGELFVTPAPTHGHETIAFRLRRILDPYVDQHGLGGVFTPRGVVQHAGSRAEPDLVVRRIAPSSAPWESVPRPILVVEITSPSTRRREHEQKRAFYLTIPVSQYWVVDADARSILVIQPERPDVVETSTLSWRPIGAAEALVIDVQRLFE
jgi:Uma2 family endonuclease